MDVNTMHKLVYETRLANLIFFVIIMNDLLLLRQKSLRLECAACDTSMRHALNPSGLLEKQRTIDNIVRECYNLDNKRQTISSGRREDSP